VIGPDSSPLRIGPFSRKVGLSAAVLRAWEARYGLLSPARTAGGYRLYGAEEATRVQRMRAYLARGLAPAESAQLVLAERRRPGPGRDLVSAWRLLDTATAQELLDGVLEDPAPDVAAAGLLPLLDVLSPERRHVAARMVETRLLTLAARRAPLGDEVTLSEGNLVAASGEVLMSVAEALGDEVLDETREHHHRPTVELDEATGQGFAHVQYSFSAHRAVVDVDVELGLLKVVELACVQDVGRVMNPLAAVGQIQGGSVQGMGLAVMEEIVVKDGTIRNPSFTDYLIPTILDTPTMPIEMIEHPDPHAPYGLRGIGEAPTISSGPAVAAAVRAATGLPLTRVPIRPEHITGG